MATRTKKPPPLKKRHTKPCKFFQLGRCPLSAEDCNFAHVLLFPGVNPSPPVYYTTGLVNGPAPAYDHSPTHDANRVAAQLSRLHISNLSPISPTPHYSPEYAHPATSPYSVYSPYYPSSWPPTSHYSDEASKYQHISTCIAHTDSSDSASTPLSTDNEVHIVTEDPQYQEHSHIIHQSRTRIVESGEVGVEKGTSATQGLGYFPPNPPPPWDMATGPYSLGSPVYGYPGESNVNGVPLTRTSSRASRASRSSSMSKYRTKPCKYFNTEKGCSSGDKCRFIHDTIPPVPAIRVRSRSKSPIPYNDTDFMNPDIDPMPSKADGEREEERTRGDKDRSRGNEIQSQEDGENNKQGPKKKFWRVIGGGVLMGNGGGNKSLDIGASTDASENNANIGGSERYDDDAADLNVSEDGRISFDGAVGMREERLKIGEVEKKKKKKAFVRLRPRSLDITFPRAVEGRQG